MLRRTFLQSLLAAVAAGAGRAAASRRPRILLRSSWQVVNIGDIAHTPGVLALIEKHIPDADVTLWASGDLTPAVAAMEHKRFPKLTIVKGSIGDDGKASNPELAEAVAAADFLLHGSGPSLVGGKDVAAFSTHTGKPFGVYGITYGGDAIHRDVMSKAKFLYFRDGVSLAKAKADGIACPVMEFSPDGAFACDLRDDAAATKYLAAAGLADGKFLCCFTRFRYTPYWEVRGTGMTERDKAHHVENGKFKDRDAAPLRAAIEGVLAATDLKVLLCPEDFSQVALLKDVIYDKLPAAARERVVWRDTFWLTDEAVSVYVRSAGLFGSEMHSPIMAVGHGVPAIVCRWKQQTTKGFMWRDVGLGDWLFDLDSEEEAAKVPAAVVKLATDLPAARAKAAAAKAVVDKRFAETMGVVRAALG